MPGITLCLFIDTGWVKVPRLFLCSQYLGPNGSRDASPASRLTQRKAGQVELSLARRLTNLTQADAGLSRHKVSIQNLRNANCAASAGTLPGAFRHPEKGYVDVYVMYRSLLS